jgi:hypothetical protein
MDADLGLPTGSPTHGNGVSSTPRATPFPALRTLHITLVPEASPPSLVPDYAPFFRAHLPRASRRGVLTVEQGSRVRGAAVMPLLPYMSVWPHRNKAK